MAKPTLDSAFDPEWQEQAWRDVDKQVIDLTADLLLRLLCELFDRGFIKLTELLWENFRYRPTVDRLNSEESRRYERAAFTDIVGAH